MKKNNWLILILLLTASICEAQFTFTGKVTDEDHNPLSAVTVRIGKNEPATFTDSLGTYTFTCAVRDPKISFSHIGYEDVVLHVSSTVIPTVILKYSFLSLQETKVNSYEINGRIRDVAAAVSVLNKASLDRFSNSSFVPAMNTVPGVKMDERSPGSYRLSIRGNLLRSTFGVRNVKVYWNGIPFTDANGTTYLNEIAFSNIGKMEVLKGPSGSMYGSGTGGVLLLSSALTAVKGKTISLQATAGSYGSFSTSAAYEQSGEHSISSFSYHHQQSDGYRNQSRMRRDVVNMAGRYFISGKQTLSANMFYSDLFYQTPGALSNAQQHADPKQARPAAGVFRGAEEQKAALYLQTVYTGFSNEYRFNSKWNNTTAVYFSHTRFRNPTIRNVERKTEQGIGVRSVTKYESRLFTGTFGSEYQYGFTGTGTYGNRFGETDTLQYQDEISSRQFNIFFQGDLNFNKGFTLNAGISYNNFHYGFMRLNELPSFLEQSDFTPQIVPRISLLKQFGNRISVYISASKGYSPPSIDEVHAGDGNFNKALEAETGINYEAGIKAGIIKNKLLFDATYYYFNLSNTIVSRRDANGADYFVNTGKTRQQGFEWSVQYIPVFNSSHFVREVRLWANYTNIYARFVHYVQGTAKYDGNKLTGTPPNVVAAGADLRTSTGFYANLTYNYTDKIPLNDANSFYADAYQLFFARIGYKKSLGKHITTELFISYDRSFNQPYSLGNDLNAAGNRFYNPSAPENVNGGIQLKWVL